MNKLKGWLRASRVQGEIPPCLHSGENMLPLLTWRITSICLDIICNKIFSCHVSVLVIVNDITAAVASQFIASLGAQNGVRRQFFKMKISELME